MTHEPRAGMPQEVADRLPEPRPLLDWAPEAEGSVPTLGPETARQTEQETGRSPGQEGGKVAEGTRSVSPATGSAGGMPRRVALKVLATAAAVPALSCDDGGGREGTEPGAVGPDGLPVVDQPASNPHASGTPADPDLINPVVPWEMKLTDAEMLTVAALCAVIIPEDDRSPSAVQVGAHHFINEWVSAPYEAHQEDLVLVRGGLVWLNTESTGRFDRPFAELTIEELHDICDDICYLPDAAPEFRAAARFFDKVRDLVSTAFWTTDAGMSDLGFIGNRAQLDFTGPPPEVLERLGLA